MRCFVVLCCAVSYMREVELTDLPLACFNWSGNNKATCADIHMGTRTRLL